MKFVGKVIEYLPDDHPFREGGKTIVYNSVVRLEELGEIPYPPNVRQMTGLQRTAVQRHLNVLVKEKKLKVTYAKIKMKNSTVIAGTYTAKLDQTNKVKNKKKKFKKGNVE